MAYGAADAVQSWLHCAMDHLAGARRLGQTQQMLFWGVHTHAPPAMPPEAFTKGVADKPRWQQDKWPKLEHRYLHRKEYPKVQKQLKMMGNMVVPNQWRLALHHLLSSS